MRENQREQSQKVANYQDQNKLLRQLYLQRMKKKQEADKQLLHKQDEDIFPQIKKIEFSQMKKQKQQQREQKAANNLYLNSLYFDSRQKKPRFFIKIFSLLNQDVAKPQKTVSQNVESIFITTFGFETETFQHLLNTSNVKLVILNDSEQKGQNRVIKQYSGFKNFTVILKSKSTQAYGVFHTKLWLIKFKTFLRVVVCTSNQHTMDWAVWQNAFWYQDFPLKSNLNNNEPKQNQKIEKPIFDFNKDFEDTLAEVLNAMLPEKQLQQLASIKIKDYLFQNVNIVLVPSIAGRHYGQNMKKQGIGKIRQIMRKFNTIKNPILTYNSTSLGVIQRNFIQQLYKSFCPQKLMFNDKNFRLIYPTQKYIQQETGGQASVLFLTQENYKKSDLGKKIFHKFDTNPQNTILGCIPHLKTILIQPEQQNAQKGILYLGSHNMTKAAWGKIEKNGSQIFISNSQLGVLFFDVELKWFKKWSPFKYPPQPYGINDEPFLRTFLK